MSLHHCAGRISISAIAVAVLLAACGDAADEAPPPEQPQPPVTRQEAPATPVETVADAVDVGEDGVARVRIGSTDQMQFTVREFSVEAGQEVELTLVHEGRLEARVMGHNVVILQAFEDTMRFGSGVIGAGGAMDNDYVPETMRDRVVAFTRIVGGGESTTVTFTAPDEAGAYPFLCTFPGHFGVMTGTMTVRQ